MSGGPGIRPEAALPSTAELEDIAVTVANEAATLVRRSIGTARSLGTKSSATDVVTSTDVASEELVRQRLAHLTPGAAIIGEENPATEGSSGIGWIVDPIDGTVNFLYDLPIVSVSIAATVHDRVVAGAVVDLLRGDTFSAHAGGGARRDGRPITANSPAGLDQALVATGYSYDPAIRHEQGQVVAGLVSRVRDVRCFGSAALHLCWVACGRLDGYYETDLKPWDIAAGALIAHEAGAQVARPSAPGGLVIAAARSVYSPFFDLVDDGTSTTWDRTAAEWPISPPPAPSGPHPPSPR